MNQSLVGRSFIVAVCTQVALFQVNAQAASWSIMQGHIGARSMISIGDEPYTFAMGEISCVVNKTQFMRGRSEEIIESKALSCKIDSQTTVAISLSCSKLLGDANQGLQINRGAQSYFPILMCFEK